MIARVFIDRPVLAMVVSIVITLVGAVSALTLPVDQYPYINPPSIVVSTSFPGATAVTAAESVAIPLEQELNGVPNMVYMKSSSSNSGSTGISITFDIGTDPNLAAIDVQNAAKQADPLLPVDVMQEGVSVDKQATIELLKVALTSDDPRYDDVYLSNFVSINVNAAIRRIPGVGRVRNTGSRSYAMRLWLRPDRMAAHGLTTSDVISAVREQNTEAAAGTIGALPGDASVSLTTPITTQGRLESAEAFNNIIVRADPDGSMIRLRDIGRAELGASAYRLQSKLDGKNAAIAQIYLLPGANALEVASQVKATMAELSRGFPNGIDWVTFYDASITIEQAIREVLITLVQALALVIFVVWLFLQNWRATMIPALAVPVSIVGTFAAMAVFGFTLNTVNLLALVLAIGIVVDDAIVVVENVERLMKDEGLSPRDATLRAMNELSGALVATSLVLAAVFVPVSFLAGITGILYREFALSITVAVLISTVVALSLSPALCALLLKPESAQPPGWLAAVFDRINAVLDVGGARYTNWVRACIVARRRAWISFAAILIGSIAVFRLLPTSFMPVEDQGRLFVDMQLPSGQSVVRSSVMADRAVEKILPHPAVKHVFSLAGESKRSGSADFAATLEVILEDWTLRAPDGYTVDRVLSEVVDELNTMVEADVYAFKPPAIAGLGSGSGVELELQDRGGTQADRLFGLAESFVAQLERHPAVADASTAAQDEVPLLQLNVDRARAKAIGIPLADIYSTTNVFTGSSNVSDFNLFGRVYRVKAQAEPEFRDRAQALQHFQVRASSGAMVPLSVVADLEQVTGPSSIVRYNMFSSASISATPAAGASSGTVIKAAQELAAEMLPPGFGYDWSGLTFQEIRSAGQMTIALALAFVFVFLFLAALYESWTIPIAVLLITPIAMLGALLTVWGRGLQNDLFFQIAFIALIGLSAKNSILIVEFARQLYEEGRDAVDAAIESARLRFRPILMTAVSFLLGVMPLVLSSGPGAISRQTMSTAILGGMVFATTIGILLVPVFFVTVMRLAAGKRRAVPGPVPGETANTRG
ncbi:MAG: efflux RND transporter permease subunit [Pseudomonadota bacterium]